MYMPACVWEKEWTDSWSRYSLIFFICVIQSIKRSFWSLIIYVYILKNLLFKNCNHVLVKISIGAIFILQNVSRHTGLFSGMKQGQKSVPDSVGICLIFSWHYKAQEQPNIKHITQLLANQEESCRLEKPVAQKKHEAVR